MCAVSSHVAHVLKRIVVATFDSQSLTLYSVGLTVYSDSNGALAPF